MFRIGMPPRKGSFTRKEDGHKAAKRAHICLHCRHSQVETWKICPQCGSKDRKYFPSRTEAKRAMQLMVMADMGEITDLEFHPSYDLMVGDHKLCKYIADARYKINGVEIVEDSKSEGKFVDPLSRHKIRHAQLQLGIKIVIPQRRGVVI